MNLIPIENSQNVIASAYDKNEKIMYVQFKNGVTYKYKDVPHELYDEFLTSPSKGGFIHQRIKSNFECEKHLNEEK